MKRTRKYPLDTEKTLNARNLPADQFRFLVSNYYQFQEWRKRSDMQLRHIGDREPLPILTYAGEACADIEEQIKKSFAIILAGGSGDISLVAAWCMAQRGIGPLLTAGLIAHIDVRRAKTAGAVWRFAGLDPTLKWIGRAAAEKLIADTLKTQDIKKPNAETARIVAGHTSHKVESVLNFATHNIDGKEIKLTAKTLSAAISKRPYNAALKQLTWHIGQCFMKQSNDPDCFYGRIYRARKDFEVKRNEAGGNAERAKTFRVGSGATKAVKDKLKAGQMPDFNIDARARRYAVKMFLSHFYFIWHFVEFKKLAPVTFIIHYDERHVHEIAPPNCDMIPGLEKEMRKAGRFKMAAE